MNSILIILELIITVVLIILLYKKQKQEGLYLYIILAYMLSILISIKNIEILTIEIPLGIILTTSIYLANNILVQEKGLESTKKVTKLLLLCSITIISIVTLTSSLNSIMLPTNTYSLMFINKIRSAVITAICPIIMINLTAIFYYQLKREKNNILLNNILTIIVMFFIDSTIFSTLSFILLIPINEIFITIAFIYTLKLLYGLITVPILYIIQKKHNK